MPNDIKKLDDGTLEVKLETGEVFKGDPLEVTTKLAEAQVNTKRWGQGFKQELETLKSVAPVPPAPVTEPTVEEKQLRNYLTTQIAADLGLKPEELKTLPAVIASQQEAVAEWKRNTAVAQFQAKYKDFPNTDEANTAVVERAEKDFGIDIDQLCAANPLQAAAVLGAAHLACVNEGIYKPLTAEQINETWANQMAAANRQSPPPMIPSRAPDSQQQTGNDPYQMDMNALRQAAIKQQLGH